MAKAKAKAKGGGKGSEKRKAEASVEPEAKKARWEMVLSSSAGEDPHCEATEKESDYEALQPLNLRPLVSFGHGSKTPRRADQSWKDPKM